MDEVDDLYRRLVSFAPNLIIIEDFEFRKGGRGGLNLFPVQLIGVARLYSLTITNPNGSQAAIVIQKAAQGKAYFTDAVLKQQGTYKRSIPHGMDASRHLLQWSTFGPGYQYNSGQQDYVKMLDSWTEDD